MKTGFGMKVTVLSCAQATFLTMYLKNRNVVGLAKQRGVLDVDLGLAGGANLMVMKFDLDVELHQFK